MPPNSLRLPGFLVAALAVLYCGGVSVLAQHTLSGGVPFVPKLVAASDEGERAIKRFQVPAGFKVELWAAEPDVAQGVALYPDNQGRIYVCETFRHSQGVTDIRGIMDWLDEDLACRTADDRLAMMKRHLGERFPDYGRNSERLRLLWDADGSGRATRSTVFADNFMHPLDGIAAGVIARGDQVWFANLPDLWLLRDANGDGVADSRRSLHHGYGVRVGFLGHDLHGLTWGPDGRLYFSIGDRGSSIEQGGQKIGNADTGCVFRCQADGSELEVFAYGLRNPQELAFDAYGNLFTGDNNSDGGDQARWVYLVEGGDSGWRIGWQFLEGRNAPNPRGPWNSAKMWYPQNDTQPAYIVPPIKNITSGPSGLAYYPGTGFPESWAGSFFLVDFRGSASGSGIWSFKLKPKGASFEVIDDQKFLWSVLATDGDFGPDGSFYVLDWVEGWNQNGKGRIYKLTHAEAGRSAAVTETKKLLAEGFGRRADGELISLLGHANMRVRQGAQFELASRKDMPWPALLDVARRGPGLLARLHALWALGQITQSHAAHPHRTVVLEELAKLLADAEPEIRANAARILGDARFRDAYEGLVRLTTDADARVRSLGVLALARLGRWEGVPAVLEMLRANADQDAVLRHAGVMALSLCAETSDLVALVNSDSEAIRLAAVVALRRQGRSEIAAFLADPSPRVVNEVAHAINDEPISGAMDQLAAMIQRPQSGDPLVRRVLNANFRWGTPESAEALARFAASGDAPENARIEALHMLADWPKNLGRDRITGLWRPTAFVRDAAIPVGAIRPVVTGLVAGGPNAVRRAAIQAAASLQLSAVTPQLAELVMRAQADGATRAEALKALASLSAPELRDALKIAAGDTDEAVRKVATRLGAETAGSDDAVGPLAAVLANGTVSERQNALATLGTLPGEAVDQFLGRWMNDLLAGKVAPEIQLDLLDAAGKRSGASLNAAVAKYNDSLPKGGETNLAPWAVCLVGGNVAEGKRIFLEKVEVSCVRCHKASGEGGEAGPELDRLITRQSREYILQSILYPNVNIAVGFDNILVSLNNGSAYAGVIKSETATELVLNSPEDGLLTVKKADIKSRERGLSGMPAGFGELLTRQEIRNLLEFISSLK
ncbi:MAG: c-type cytochrome [Pedosphaera sp.]|nr:c-type cytochrome [Pedosphaera sp.]